MYTAVGSLKGFEGLVESFVEAPLNDFVLHSYRRGPQPRLGLRLRPRAPRRPELHALQDLAPHTPRQRGPVTPKHFDRLSLIPHGRLTSSEPIDVLSSHPFYVSIPGRLSLWLAHNGVLDKARLARELSMEGLVDAHADSYFLAHRLGPKRREAKHRPAREGD